MECYEQYKDSDVEWIGEIPSYWKVKKLKRLIKNLESGVSVNATDFPASAGSCGILKTSCVYNYVFDCRENKEIWPSELEKARVNPRKDELIISRMNTPELVGASGYVSENHNNLFLPDRLWQTVFFDNLPLDRKWLAFVVKSLRFRNLLSILATGTSPSMKNLSQEGFLNIGIPFPGQVEQTAIANYLGHKTVEIDALISQKERLLKLYEEEKSVIINQAVTKGIDSDALLKDSGVEWLGEIPVGWKVKRLRYTGECKNGVSAGADYFGSGHPFVSYSDVYKNPILPKVVDGLAQSSKEDQENYSILYGDVLFTRTSETIDEIGLTSTCLKTLSDAIFAGFLIRYRPSDSLLHPEFSKYYFRSTLHRRFFVKEMNLVTRASLSQELLKKMPVLLPPIDEQMNIAEFLDIEVANIDARIRKTKRIIELQKEYRTALISEVITGKVKVPSLESNEVVQ